MRTILFLCLLLLISCQQDTDEIQVVFEGKTYTFPRMIDQLEAYELISPNLTPEQKFVIADQLHTIPSLVYKENSRDHGSSVTLIKSQASSMILFIYDNPGWLQVPFASSTSNSMEASFFWNYTYTCVDDPMHWAKVLVRLPNTPPSGSWLKIRWWDGCLVPHEDDTYYVTRSPATKDNWCLITPACNYIPSNNYIPAIWTSTCP